MPLDLKYLDACNLLMVAMQPGWEGSRGIGMEVAHATENGIPILYINPQPILAEKGDCRWS
jgi:hypothetical protein